MAKINVLPKEIAELIAAGEVVERPASVVKELLENAIDAGAKNVTVEIQNGGIKYIRITDNGCGIEREDIANAFKSHATSKIKHKDDLDAIMTLGFRGEALASIAAVAKVEVLTRTPNEQTGTRYCICAGEEELIDDAGCPKGTTIVVRDLFFNTPARMKFLKKDVTEANAVAGVVDKIALSHPDVSIRFIREGKNTLFTSGSGDLKTTAFEILGRDFSDGLMQAEYTYEGVEVKGLVSKPSKSRANRNMQFFFVNGRLVKTGTGSAALTEAYKNTVMVGKFPYCILNINTNPMLVDVNVHPAKIEVRFANERSVFSAVYYAAKNALEMRDTPPLVCLQRKLEPSLFEQARPQTEQLRMPQKNPDFWQNQSANEFSHNLHKDEYKNEPKSNSSFNINTYRTTNENGPKISSPNVVNAPETVKAQVTTSQDDFLSSVASPKIDLPLESEEPSTLDYFYSKQNKAKEENLREENQVQQTWEEIKASSKEEYEEHENKEAQNEDKGNSEEQITVIGEAFKTYIIVQKGNSLFMVDKHAAHERMLFNKLKKNDHINRQVLLSPISVTLSKEEYSAVLDNLDLLLESGFEAEDFGSGMVIVHECPMEVSADDVADLVCELAGYLAQNRQRVITEKKNWLLSLLACKAAIKAGYNTTQYEREAFIKRLFSDNEVRYCPHGRPVMIEITRGELERNFGRE